MDFLAGGGCVLLWLRYGGFVLLSLWYPLGIVSDRFVKPYVRKVPPELQMVSTFFYCDRVGCTPWHREPATREVVCIQGTIMTADACFLFEGGFGTSWTS